MNEIRAEHEAAAMPARLSIDEAAWLELRRDPRALGALALWLILIAISAVLFVRMLGGAFADRISAVSFGAGMLVFTGGGVLSFLLAWPSVMSLLREWPPLRVVAVLAAFVLFPEFLLALAIPTRGPLPATLFAAACWISGLALVLQIAGLKLAEFCSWPWSTLWSGDARGTSPQSSPRGSDALQLEIDSKPTAGDGALEPPIPDSADRDSLEEEIGAGASLWMRRYRGPDGAERLEGIAAAEFASGQKQASVHLAFCPPFARKPELTCLPDDEGAVRLKVGALYAYGARLDVKRTSGAAEPLVVPIHFAAAEG